MISGRPDINQVLSQMREMRSQVQAPSSAASNIAKAGGEEGSGQTVERADFAEMLKNAVDNVNALQKESTQLAQSYERGDEGVDLPQVMIGLQKSSVSFEAMTQVRNKLVDAYEKIMNMPI
ncbi:MULTISPECIES: flagellar hook-basal body complex protein FliE [Marinomonas]|uniref:Flagellar hook-basal body complex protein FliE n=1 Tax=Marinomonas arctica TaxID=383750 RepID=A0A7H1J3D6_9GAMM|nr:MULTISPECIES: flagellar hook-basal body complex protein FliE [Marinomonas]MCS7485975.1 flagellar hook-basal body protein FliE [Marinomonas sp. BSi20414]QNT05002.1 flagellar hook-basal body complex protein FliE [Marinomonas arctica]GGN16887.1 flagellar hook-basal body complex protein FliE [Marinomonas arctica]